MGSWGHGPFDNDAAADLLIYIEEAGARGWSVVRKALQSKYAQDVVGAAEVVALAVGQGTRKDQRTLAFAVGRTTAVPWVRKYARLLPADLPSLAIDRCRTVLQQARKTAKPAPKHQRTLGGVKLLNVFLDEGESARKWQATIASLIRRLERGRRKRHS
jgi:hypothetical protein